MDHAPSVQMQYIPPDFIDNFEFFKDVDEIFEFSEADFTENDGKDYLV